MRTADELRSEMERWKAELQKCVAANDTFGTMLLTGKIKSIRRELSTIGDADAVVRRKG